MSKKFEKLDEILEYIQLKFKRSSKVPKVKYAGFKFLRKPDGIRYSFECTQGFEVVNYKILGLNSISIDSFVAGYAMKNNFIISSKNQILLHDLHVINVYDSGVQFLSNGAIDFAFFLDNSDATTNMLYQWIYKEPSEIKAMWQSSDEEIVKSILRETCVNTSMQPILNRKRRRFIFEENEE